MGPPLASGGPITAVVRTHSATSWICLGGLLVRYPAGTPQIRYRPPTPFDLHNYNSIAVSTVNNARRGAKFDLFQTRFNDILAEL